MIPRQEFLKRLVNQPEVDKAEKLKKAHRLKRIKNMISTFSDFSPSLEIMKDKDKTSKADLRLVEREIEKFKKFHS